MAVANPHEPLSEESEGLDDHSETVQIESTVDWQALHDNALDALMYLPVFGPMVYAIWSVSRRAPKRRPDVPLPVHSLAQVFPSIGVWLNAVPCGGLNARR